MWVQAWMVESVASLAATVEEPQSVVQLKVWGRKACTRVVSTTHTGTGEVGRRQPRVWPCVEVERMGGKERKKKRGRVVGILYWWGEEEGEANGWVVTNVIVWWCVDNNGGERKRREEEGSGRVSVL